MDMPKRNQQADYRYGYHGEYAEEEELGGTHSFELRLWDARIGRWMSPDPYGQFASPYLGMGNRPNSSVDPDGGCTLENGEPCPIDFRGIDYFGNYYGDANIIQDDAVSGLYYWSHEQGGVNSIGEGTANVFTLNIEASIISEYNQIFQSIPDFNTSNLAVNTPQIFDTNKRKREIYTWTEPSARIGLGVIQGFKEAPFIILPEMAISKAARAFEMWKATRLGAYSGKSIGYTEIVGVGANLSRSTTGGIDTPFNATREGYKGGQIMSIGQPYLYGRGVSPVLNTLPAGASMTRPAVYATGNGLVDYSVGIGGAAAVIWYGVMYQHNRGKGN